MLHMMTSNNIANSGILSYRAMRRVPHFEHLQGHCKDVWQTPSERQVLAVFVADNFQAHAMPYLINRPMQPAHQEYAEREAVCNDDQDGFRRESACSVWSATTVGSHTSAHAWCVAQSSRRSNASLGTCIDVSHEVVLEDGHAVIHICCRANMPVRPK